MSGVLSIGGGGEEAWACAAGAIGARGTLEMRGGELGRSPPGMGFELGVPGRGGARGSELRRPEENGGDEGGVRTPSGMETGGADGVIAGADGIVGSLAAGGFSDAAAATVDDSGEEDFRLTGGGGGACEPRGGASTSSINASASISDSSFGSWIICVIWASRTPPPGRAGHAQQNIIVLVPESPHARAEVLQ
jgi:hypothetical protein